jgi:hypothetical protein
LGEMDESVSAVERSRGNEIFDEIDSRAERATDRMEDVSVSVSLDREPGLVAFVVAV